MLKRIFLSALILLNWATSSLAQDTYVVHQFGNSLSNWASSRNTFSALESLERLCSKSPAIRVEDNIMSSLASLNGLSLSKGYTWENYVTFMCRSLFILITCILSLNVYSQNTAIVQRYCNSFASWASDKNIIFLHEMENLRSESPSFRIGNKLMNQLASKNGLPKTDTYDWDIYVPCIQKEVDNGIEISFSNIKNVPKDYIEHDYPGLEYVSCNISIKGSVITELRDLFILKNSKIVKITDYIETTDIAIGKKKIEIDYLDLARCAFADQDYLKCYNLYKEGGLKSLNKTAKKQYGYRSESDIFPFVESCIALGKWDEAMHGITDNDVITNRKTWVNGIEWKLNPEDLKNWSKEKNPLMDYLLKKTYKFYCYNPTRIQYSPIVKHVSKCRNKSMDEMLSDASSYFWNERSSWLNEIPLRAAAELGHFEAQKQLGMYYLTGKNTDPVSRNNNAITCDTIKAVSWFEQAAIQGNIESANIAAHFYLSGDGVKQDFFKAFALYNMHSNQNNYDTQYGLGLCYYLGYGVQRNIQTALSYLIESEDWHAEVPYLIGNIYYMDNYNPKAIIYYNRALKRNSLNKSVRRSILMNLSECNRYGRCGLPINVSEADRLLNEAHNIELSDMQDINDYLISLTKIYLTNENN